MSWYYHHIVYPKNRMFLPTAEELISLSEHFIKNEWVINPHSDRYRKYLQSIGKENAVLMEGWGCVAYSMYESSRALPRVGRSNIREICNPFRLDILNEMLGEDLEVAYGQLDDEFQMMKIRFPLTDNKNKHFFPKGYNFYIYYSPDFVLHHGEYNKKENYRWVNESLQVIRDQKCECGRETLTFIGKGPMHDFLGEKLYFRYPDCNRLINIVNILQLEKPIPFSRFGFIFCIDANTENFDFDSATITEDFRRTISLITGEEFLEGCFYR